MQAGGKILRIRIFTGREMLYYRIIAELSLLVVLQVYLHYLDISGQTSQSGMSVNLLQHYYYQHRFCNCLWNLKCAFPVRTSCPNFPRGNSYHLICKQAVLYVAFLADNGKSCLTILSDFWMKFVSVLTAACREQLIESF